MSYFQLQQNQLESIMALEIIHPEHINRPGDSPILFQQKLKAATTGRNLQFFVPLEPCILNRNICCNALCKMKQQNCLKIQAHLHVNRLSM